MKIDYFNIPEIHVTYKDNVKTSERHQVRCANDIVELFKIAFEDCMQHHEEAYVVFLNRKNKVLGISNISKCGVAATIIDIKIILQTALKVHASGIIISHNHPSSELTPSNEDKKITEQLKEACDIIGISLLDHIIMTQEDFYSFANEGQLD